ncbi:MAG: hypothetical protein KDA52_13665 [Planctomycetaceae bacterium]|nr:hypothetical protein [Planctomycetaceae bacterium]
MSAIDEITAHEQANRNEVSALWDKLGGTDLETQVIHPPGHDPKAHKRIDDDYRDYELQGPIYRIGSTGRHWADNRPAYIFGDVDANDHAKGNSADTIHSCDDNCPDYMTLFTSKGGKGRGFIVAFDPDNAPYSPNRERQAIIGEQVKALLRRDGFPVDCIDTIGQNGWFWATDAKPEGYKIIKRATRKLTGNELPPPEPPSQITTKGRTLDQPPATLTEGTKTLIEFLNSIGCIAIWQPEHGCLHTHTAGLQQAHGHFNLPGNFQTISPATDLSHANCLYFPGDDKGVSA